MAELASDMEIRKKGMTILFIKKSASSKSMVSLQILISDHWKQAHLGELKRMSMKKKMWVILRFGKLGVLKMAMFFGKQSLAKAVLAGILNAVL